MRHAEVCCCRDCGSATLTDMMERTGDESAKLVLAIAGLQCSVEPLVVDDVALPYRAVCDVAQLIEAKLDGLREIVDTGMPDPYAGPTDDLIEAIQDDLRTLLNSWRRDP